MYDLVGDLFGLAQAALPKAANQLLSAGPFDKFDDPARGSLRHRFSEPVNSPGFRSLEPEQRFDSMSLELCSAPQILQLYREGKARDLSADALHELCSSGRRPAGSDQIVAN